MSTSATCALFFGVCASSVSAQTIDYGSLELLFGEAVTTSATGKPQRASEAPVPLEIVSAEDIKRTGANNIPDAIQFSLGVDVVRFSTEGAEVGVRGFYSPFNSRLLVLLNGRQVYSDHFGMTFWNAIPVQMAEIRQIEIVRGPNTALFGFNAATGVINIVTYDPNYEPVNEVRAIYGSQNTKEISAVFSSKLGDKGGISISGSYLEGDVFDTDGPELFPDIEPNTTAFAARANYQIAPNTVIDGEITYSQTDRLGFSAVIAAQSFPVETFSLKGGFVNDGSFGLLKGQVYYNQLSHDPNSPGLALLEFSNDIVVAQLEDLFKIGTDHSVRLFAEYRNNSTNADSPVNPFNDDVSTSFNSFAFAGMWDWQISPTLNLVTSLRYDTVNFERQGPIVPGFGLENDDFDRNIDEITYNAGLVWSVTDADKVTLSAARGARLPSLIEFGGGGAVPGPAPGTNLVFFGNPDLPAQGVDSFNLGYTHVASSINTTFEANVFFQQVNANFTVGNLVPNAVIPPNVVLQPFDLGSSEEVGIEFKAQGSLENVWWEFNYAYLDVEDSLNNRAPNGLFLRGLEFEGITPKHRINAHIGGRLAEKFEVDLFAQWVDERSFLSRVPGGGASFLNIDDFLSLTGRATYKFNDNVDLTFNAQAFNQGEFRANAGEEIESRFFLRLGVRW